MTINFETTLKDIQKALDVTPVFLLIKYGILQGYTGDPIEPQQMLEPLEFNLVEIPDYPLEDEYVLDVVWHKDVESNGLAGDHSLWAKLIALTYALPKELTKKEDTFLQLLVKGESIPFYGDIDRGLLAQLALGQYEEVNEEEDILMYDFFLYDPYLLPNEGNSHIFEKGLSAIGDSFQWDLSIPAEEYIQLLVPLNGIEKRILGGLEFEIIPVSSERWKSTVLFNEISRETRYYYVKDDVILEGLCLIAEVFTHIIAGNIPDNKVRTALFRDATDLLAPTTSYGNPGSLNIQIALGDVGFLTFNQGHLAHPDAYAPWDENHGTWFTIENQSYPKRENYVIEFSRMGIPVFPHHQMNHIRVGPCAAGVGISQMGDYLVTDKNVDKSHKIPNRFSLQTRTPADLKTATAVELETFDL